MSEVPEKPTATKPTRKKKMLRTGPSALTGSAAAKRMAAVLLEVLSGLVGPQDGATTLGVSLSRYYVLETRALQGFVAALEPRPKGRTVRPEQQLEAAVRDKRRLERELARHQVLLRAAHRSLGLSPAARAGASSRDAATKSDTGKTGTAGRKRRGRRIGRAAATIARLRETSSSAEQPTPSPEPTPTAAGD